MAPPPAADPHSGDAENLLDARLMAIAEAHPDRLAAWMRNEPGQWGFFAGQAITAVRELVGRRLTDSERRFVWHRMWLALQEKQRQQTEL